MTIETLRQVPLFESLDNEAAGELCHLLDSLDCKAGAFLFRTGDEGDAMYLIERGKVRICVRARDGHEVTLTELGRGDFFGEMALLDGQRSADAVIVEDATLAVLSREHFLSFMRGSPDVALEMLVTRALNIEDQKLLALMVKRVGVALRIQRNNDTVQSVSGPGQFLLWEIPR